MKLAEKEKEFWEEGVRYLKCLFPIEFLPNYTNILEGDGARILMHATVFPRKKEVLDLIQTARESKSYVAILVADIPGN
jgi:hypothetical protein